MRRLVLVLMTLLFYEVTLQGQTWFSQRRWDIGLEYNNYSFNVTARYNARKGAWRAFASYRPMISRIIEDRIVNYFVNEYTFSFGYEKYLARYDNFFSYYGSDVGFFHTLSHYKQDRVYLRPFIGAGLRLGRMSLFLEQSFYLSNIKLPDQIGFFTNGITAYSGNYVVGVMYNLGREKNYEILPYARNWEIVLATEHKKQVYERDNRIIFVRNLTDRGSARISYEFDNTFTAVNKITDLGTAKVKLNSTMVKLFNNLKLGYQYYFLTSDIGYKRYKTTVRLYTGFDIGFIVNQDFDKSSLTYIDSDSTVAAKLCQGLYNLSSEYLLGARIKLTQRLWFGYEYNLVIMNKRYYYVKARNYLGTFLSRSEDYPGNFSTSFFYLSVLL